MKITEPTPGAPCWVELGTSDVAAAAIYYREVFGWHPATEPRAGAGGYTIFSAGDARVAAASPLYAAGQPTAWTVTFATRDAEALATSVSEAGGSVLVDPRDVFDMGRFAVFADPQGAAFAVWQAGSFAGAELLNEPGALGWVELATGDPETAVAFYSRIFGWTVRSHGTYAQWGIEGADFGGMSTVQDRDREDVRPHWLPYFAVESVDGTATRAADSGGMLLMAPTDVPDGPRIAMVRDPQGAVFGIHQAGTEG
ncbi:VOC family protein [Streptomyces noursei]|uniref:VOC family protein n=1 Tax=Streptomyces noursei TaxID=1971 RepID=UPI00045EF5D9|nr:VOC family protein [Streptomyces noursei]AIA02255.1 hydroxylase [Streptomyces noursei]MCZ0972288.1 VOC family protein [Streptomyces noursei]